ncbi:MAG: type II toxin-antitoxin system RelE/ParE family toxin [Candidatus Dependentiae bacterium]
MLKSSFVGYKIEFAVQAKKDLKKIDKPQLKKINQKLEGLVSSDFNQDIKKLEGTTESIYRMRVGDYRVVFQVKHNVITILVIGIAHRKQVYRRY